MGSAEGAGLLDEVLVELLVEFLVEFLVGPDVSSCIVQTYSWEVNEWLDEVRRRYI